MIRSILHLRDVSHKCLFTTLQGYKIDLNTYNVCQHIRGLKIQRPRIRKGFSKNLQQRHENTLHASRLWKPFGFAILFSGSTIIGATIWEYESRRKQAYSIYNHYRQELRVHQTEWIITFQDWWRNLSDGQKMFVPICLINLLVHFAWNIPKLYPIMTQYFVASVHRNVRCWPMVLSMFSHNSLPHLFINMYVLYTFSNLVVSTLGKEQFLALYLTSGVVASLFSYVHKIAFNLPVNSLGASGAIMGVIGFLCTEYPNMQLSILFAPMFTFTADTGLKAILCVEVLGSILQWRFIDHAAHLGGALFGIFWHRWGNTYIWKKRVVLLQQWHKLRNS